MSEEIASETLQRLRTSLIDEEALPIPITPERTPVAIPIAGDIARSSRFDDYGECQFIVIGGPHSGCIVTLATAKHNCGDYSVSARCSCGAEYACASGGCHSHPRQGPTGDRALGRCVEAALSIPNYLWPGVYPPQEIVVALARATACYSDEMLLLYFAGLTVRLGSVLAQLLQKKVTFREARTFLRHTPEWGYWRDDE